MLRRFHSLTYKFLVPVFIVLILIGIVINYEVSRSIKKTLLNQASSQVVDFVRLQASRHAITAADFDYKQNKGHNHFATLAKEVTTNDVIRVKAWDTSLAVVYSDDKKLIGRTFGPNPELKESLETGKPSIEIAKPTAPENVDERNFKEFLEIYVPIIPKSSTHPVGVVEIYYKLNGLETTLQETQRLLFITVFSSLLLLGILIWLALSYFVVRPLKTLQAATDAISNGDLEQSVSIRSKDEIGALGTAFNHMLIGLRHLQELKNEFVFIAAHELRAPVTTIKGYLSMLEENPQKQRDYLAEVNAANAQLEQLVDDLLEIARSDAGKLKISMREVNLSQAIEATIKLFIPAAEKKDIRIDYERSAYPHFVKADEKRLNEVIANLLSNAIKYGSQAGYIKIRHDVDEGCVITTFADNGIGITAEAQPHMFEKFYRSPDVQQSGVKGTGLGMYITKELVERMDGEISFKSTYGKGTTFSVRLVEIKK